MTSPPTGHVYMCTVPPACRKIATANIHMNQLALDVGYSKLLASALAFACLTPPTQPLPPSLPPLPLSLPPLQRSRQSSLVCNAEHKPTTSSSVSRSDILRQGGLASFAGVLALTGSGNGLSFPFTPAPAAAAVAAEEQIYFDEKYKVAFEHIPKEWERTDTTVGTNNMDSRRIVVFKDPASQANVFIAYTVRVRLPCLPPSLPPSLPLDLKMMRTR